MRFGFGLKGQRSNLSRLTGDWAWLADLHSLGPLDPDVVEAVGLPAMDRARPDLDFPE